MPVLFSGCPNFPRNAFPSRDGFLLTVTAAAFVYIGPFDFAAHPLEMVYIGAYVVVAIMVGIALLKYGTGLATK